MSVTKTIIDSDEIYQEKNKKYTPELIAEANVILGILQERKQIKSWHIEFFPEEEDDDDDEEGEDTSGVDDWESRREMME